MGIVGIYKITSPTGKIYIGQSWDIKKRFGRYLSNHINKMQKKLFSSFEKHTKTAHKFEVIHELPNDIEQIVLDIYEQLYMDLYRSAGVTLLNLREGGSRGKQSEETRKKISESAKGRVSNNKGKKFSKEHRQRISIALTGKKLSPDHCKNMSKSRKGNPTWNKGLTGVLKQSEETKLKRSISMKLYYKQKKAS